MITSGFYHKVANEIHLIKAIRVLKYDSGYLKTVTTFACVCAHVKTPHSIIQCR